MTAYCYQNASRILMLLPALLLLVQFVLPADSFAQEAKTILFIYNADLNDESVNNDTGGINDEDHLYLSILEDEMGYNVVRIDQDDVSPADTAGVDAIFISESVGSGTVVTNFIAPTTGGGEFGNYDLPIINAEIHTLDEMLWIKSQPQPPYGVDFAYGFADSDRINILPVDHPILGGLRQGPVTVYDDPPENEPANQIAYGVPNGEGTVVAAAPGSATFNGLPIPRFPEGMRASLFTFEEGDLMHDTDSLQVTAAARRVGFFAHSRGSENLDEIGQALFKNTVAWALGDEDKIQDIEGDPYRVLFIYNADLNDESVNNDTGGINDEDHLYLTILQDSLGFEPVLVDQDDVSPADTAGVDAIFISESVGSGTVVTNFIAPTTGGGEFGNYDLPIINAEIHTLDEMLWIKSQPQPPYGVDFAYGFVNAETIEVQESDHPILGGLMNGVYDVYNDPPENEDVNQVGYAVPQSEWAEIIAAVAPGTPPEDPGFDEMRATIFTYERGDTLVSSDTLDLVAADRRATFFAHTRGSENLNLTGQQLFINTVLWATGRDSEVRTIEDDPVAREDEVEVPSSFAIESIYPNPFNPSATVALRIREAGPYAVNVYDVLGRLVQKYALDITVPGQQHVSLDMENKASGLYLIQVVQTQTGKAAVTRAMLVR